MVLQNRVTPFGTIEADPARGTYMGNRGCLHDSQQGLGTRRWTTHCWVICELQFKGRRRPVMPPNRYTALFFLDEAVALAAGHRPCGECRRPAHRRFVDAWKRGTSWVEPREPRAGDIDRHLHADRIVKPRTQRRFTSPIDDLPEGSLMIFADAPATPWLVRRESIHPWSHSGYGDPRPRPSGLGVLVLTPRSTVAALASGYLPNLHPSAYERFVAWHERSASAPTASSSWS